MLTTPRHVVITGASRGLGAALARGLAAPGVTLGLIARDAASLAAVAADCRQRGAQVATAALDVRDAAVMAAQLLAWDTARPIDWAIANAGVSAGTRPDGTLEGLAAVRHQVEVNLLGAANVIEPLLSPMLARGAGSLALIGSIAGFRGLPDAPGYCASKAGLWAYGEALRAAHAPAGLRVTVVAPGFFRSAMSARVLGAPGRPLSTEAVAARIIGGLERGAARVVVPWAGGTGLRLLALLPAALGDRLVRLVRFRVREE